MAVSFILNAVLHGLLRGVVGSSSCLSSILERVVPWKKIAAALGSQELLSKAAYSLVKKYIRFFGSLHLFFYLQQGTYAVTICYQHA